MAGSNGVECVQGSAFGGKMGRDSAEKMGKEAISKAISMMDLPPWHPPGGS